MGLRVDLAFPSLSCPDLNVLDLGLFNTIQSIQHQYNQKTWKNWLKWLEPVLTIYI